MHPEQNYFINCGGTFPQSLELFMNTFPEAENFKLVTFLKHDAYKQIWTQTQIWIGRRDYKNLRKRYCRMDKEKNACG